MSDRRVTPANGRVAAAQLRSEQGFTLVELLVVIGIISILAALLALAMIWLDRSGFAEFLNDVNWIVPSSRGSRSSTKDS